MQFSETLRIAISSLLVNRLRSILTTLGIIIGVGAVIGLVSLGRAVEDFIASEFSDLGSNILEVRSSRPNSPTRVRVDPLTTIEADALSNPIIAPSIANVAQSYSLGGTVRLGTELIAPPLQGVSANYAELRSWSVLLGDFITLDDVESAGRVAVLGLDVVESLFGQRTFNPVGQIIRINDRPFTVVGVMTERGGTFVSEDNVVLIPISTAQTRLANARARDGGQIVSTIYVEVINEDLVPQATSEIENYLNEKHGIVFADEQDYTISSSADLLETINQLSGTLTIFLVLIASVSLLVGGIGIMNIMLVSVTERTREIGLRKSVGARSRDILSQFLIESTLLSLLGGILGIAVGWLASTIGTALIPDLTITLSLDAVILAVGVSTLVGVFFGYYPANRAANMKPIDALRFE
jgi:putative ABC transport system permease protein